MKSVESTVSGFNKNVTRRSAIAGAALAAAGLAFSTATGCAPAKETKRNEENAASPSAYSTSVERTGEWDMPPFKDTPDTTIDTDIVVMGSGMAGFSAALTAAEAGAKVVIIEKNPTVGGNTYYSSGGFGIGTPYQKEAGVNLTPNDVMQKVYDYHHYMTNAILWNQLVKNAQANYEWLENHGVAFEGLRNEGDFPTQHWYPKRAELNAAGKPEGSVAISALEASARAAGIDIYTGYRVTHALMDGETVVGVQAEGDDVMNVNAKAVILAGCGVGCNLDMIAEYTDRVRDNFVYQGIPSITGDDIMIAMEAGMGRPFKISAPNHSCGIDGLGTTSHLNDAAAMEPTNIWVNQDGVRFMNEELAMSYVFASNSIQSYSRCFCLIDQNAIDRFVMDGVKVVNGMIAEGTKLVNVPDELEQQLSQGNESFHKADSLEELATQLGMKPETLTATVDEYNQFATSGVDNQFGKKAEYMFKLEKAPFYAIRIKASCLNWKGGIRINSKGEVTKDDGSIIPGLYNASLSCAGFQGESYCYQLPATSQGVALSTGRIAGASAAEYVSA